MAHRQSNVLEIPELNSEIDPLGVYVVPLTGTAEVGDERSRGLQVRGRRCPGGRGVTETVKRQTTKSLSFTWIIGGFIVI